MEGIVKWVRPEYGVIKSGDSSFIFYPSSVEGDPVDKGDKVTFEEVIGAKNPQAINVMKVGE